LILIFQLFISLLFPESIMLF